MRFAMLIPVVLLALACRPVVSTEYWVETHGPDGFTQQRIDPRIDRYTVYRLDTYNNGKRKGTPLAEVNP